jgi:hypothetical protein
MSPKYSLNELDYKKILQTLAFSGISAMLAALIIVIGETEFPPQYAFLVPVINTILYMGKKYFEGEV